MAVTAQRDLVRLALAPSATEREKAERTHNMIRDRLESDPILAKYSVDTYLQGSYKNSTNVRGDSDVDMGCRTGDIFLYELSDLPDTPIPTYYGPTKSLKQQVQESISPAPYSFQDYRHDVYKSLMLQYDNVVDGNKAITVPGNTYRLDADVLPCVAFRWYYGTYQNTAAYHDGIAFLTKTNERIVNFPQQHFENLGAKDRRNGNKVKGCIRIAKRIRNEFQEQDRWDQKRSPSCYLESLIWNVPDSHFIGGYPTVLQNVLAYLDNDLREKRGTDELNSYTQANEIFYLFHHKFWNVDDALAFIDLIWNAAFSE